MQDADPRSRFLCSECGQIHDVILAYGPAAPNAYFLVPENQRAERCDLTRDVCRVDEQFYILGNLELPILDLESVFSWNVWVSLSKENMMRTHELWESDARIEEAPYFGWLCSTLPGYPETVGLKTNVHTRVVGRRPFIEVQQSEHPLAIEQRDGITKKRIQHLARMIAHPEA